MSKRCLATRELEIRFRASRHRRNIVLAIFLANLAACLYLAALWWPALCLILPCCHALRNAMVDGCIEMTEGRNFAELSEKMNDGLVEIARMKCRLETV